MAVPTAEIREVCEVYETKLDPEMLEKVRYVEGRYNAEWSRLTSSKKTGSTGGGRKSGKRPRKR